MKFSWCICIALAIFVEAIFIADLVGDPEEFSLSSIEFNGYLIMGEEVAVSLKNVETGRSLWLKRDQEYRGVRVTSFDRDTPSVTLANEVGTKLLTLSKVKIVSLESVLSQGTEIDPTVANANRDAFSEQMQDLLIGQLNREERRQSARDERAIRWRQHRASR